MSASPMITQQMLDQIQKGTFRSMTNPACTIMALLTKENIIAQYKGTSTLQNKALKVMSELCRLVKMRSRNNLAALNIKNWGPQFLASFEQLRSFGFGKYFFAPDAAAAAQAVPLANIVPAAPAANVAPVAPIANVAPAAPAAPAANIVPPAANTPITPIVPINTKTKTLRKVQEELSKLQDVVAQALGNSPAAAPAAGGYRKTRKSQKKSSRRRVR